jgi:glycosyltransferase involved in cell wall biosynthesis
VARLTGVPVVLSSIHAFYRSKPRLELLLDMVTARLTDGVIVVSEAVRQFAIADLKIPDNKIDVVYNGITSLPVVVDVESIRRIRAEIGLRSDSSVVACVASLKEVKGHKYLLQAMPLILRDVPNAQFLIIGDGPLQPELRSLATALGIADKVCFAGLREDVRTILPAIDILVQPSLQETFSLAILEAMAAEKTVVATKVGGIPELVEDGRTGLLVPPENPSAIAQAVVSLLTSPDKSRMFGVAGGQRLREFFTDEKMVRRHEEIYEFYLERKGVL